MDKVGMKKMMILKMFNRHTAVHLKKELIRIAAVIAWLMGIT